MSIKKLLTEVDATSLSRTRDFCKVDPGIDDEILKLEILAARRKVIGCVGDGIDDFFDNNPIFEGVVLIDVYTHYNNRDKDSSAMIFPHSSYQDDINSLKDEYRLLIEQQNDSVAGKENLEVNDETSS